MRSTPDGSRSLSNKKTTRAGKPVALSSHEAQRQQLDPTMSNSSQRSRDLSSCTVLVTGATGYIGSRLVPRLLDSGARVHVLARHPDKLHDVPWCDQVSVCRGDLSDEHSLLEALRGVDIAYHLVHSMGMSSDFEREERESTTTFVRAAEHANVQRIVHLSGLHPQDTEYLSPHLRSRVEVGRILLSSAVPAVVLQAGVVIGSGSASFELIRHLTTRLPVMVTPRWVHNHIQPIAIRDVIHYLVAAAICEHDRLTVDVGASDVMTYGEMMQVFADNAGLHRRIMMPVPVLSPTLSSHWVGLVTPMPPGLAGPLIESLRCEAIVNNDNADAVLGPPAGGRTSYRDAVRQALRVPIGPRRPARWNEADPLGDPATQIPSDPPWAGVRPPTVWTRRSETR